MFWRGDWKLFWNISDFTDFLKLLWAIEKTTLNDAGIKQKQNEKKHAVFPAKISCKKMRVRPQEKIARKMGVKKIRILTLKLFDASLTSNIVVRYSFDIKKNIWKVWSMSDHPFHSMAGHFFKKCSKFCQKIAPGVHFLRKNVVPCLCNKKNK